MPVNIKNLDALPEAAKFLAYAKEDVQTKFWRTRDPFEQLEFILGEVETFLGDIGFEEVNENNNKRK